MTSVVLDLPWPPSLNTYYRHVGRKVLISEKGRAYRHQVLACALRGLARFHFRESHRLAVTIEAYPPDNRARDLDNLPKALLDALQKASVIVNDSQIDRLHIGRMPKCAGGQVRVSITEATP